MATCLTPWKHAPGSRSQRLMDELSYAMFMSVSSHLPHRDQLVLKGRGANTGVQMDADQKPDEYDSWLCAHSKKDISYIFFRKLCVWLLLTYTSQSYGNELKCTSFISINPKNPKNLFCTLILGCSGTHWTCQWEEKQRRKNCNLARLCGIIMCDCYSYL